MKETKMQITAAEITAHLETLTAVELRKLGGTMGIKGASKGKKADLVAAIAEIRIAQAEALAEQERAAAAAAAPAAPKKGMCGICGIRKNYSGNANGEKAPRLSEMCNPCYAEGGWENTHSDSNHEAILATPESERTAKQMEEIDGCWICYPELNLAQATPRAGRSRAGMVIIAKGSEIHKSQTFRVAAEAAGWTVTVQSETYELPEGTEGEGTRYYATATRGESHISLAWDGRAYDYQESGAQLGGKARKVRNLKEALRLL